MSSHRGTGTAEERIADYLSGMSLRQVGAKYGVQAVSIRAQLERNNIPLRPMGRMKEFLDSEAGREVVRRYQDGESQESISRALGFSQTKVSRALAAADVPTGPRNYRGKKHWAWKGGRHTAGGYLWVHVEPGEPFAEMRNSIGYVPEHRLVMAQSLGRTLTKGETVHHINGDRKDNRLENLQLRQGNHGNGAQHRCLNCGSTNVEATPLD